MPQRNLSPRHFSRQRPWSSIIWIYPRFNLLSRARYSLESIRHAGHNNRIGNLMLIIIDKRLLLFTDLVQGISETAMRSDFYNANALCCVCGLWISVPVFIGGWKGTRQRFSSVNDWYTIDFEYAFRDRLSISREKSRLCTGAKRKVR